MPVFVDANVLVYSRDASEPEKQPLAVEWLAFVWRTRTGRLSFQVLHEYYVTVTGKLKPGLDPEAARQDVRNLLQWAPVRLDAAALEGAWAIQSRYRLSFWDSLIASTAQIAGCDVLLTEDLQDGLLVDRLRVVNPFEHRPSETS